MKPAYIILAVAAFAFAKQWGNAYFNRLSIKPSSFKFRLAPLGGVLQVEIKNANAQTLILNDLQGNVEYGGTIIGAFQLMQSVPIEGKAISILDIDVQISATSIATEILDLIQNGGNPLMIRVFGAANANGLRIPFDVNKGIALL